MPTELHVLNTLGDVGQLDNSINWIGVHGGVLCIVIYPVSIKPSKKVAKRFDQYWLPPELRAGEPRDFLALLTFDETGDLTAIGYPLLEPTWGEGIRVIPIVGEINPREWLRVGLTVATQVTYHERPDRRALTFEVVEQEGEKLFTLTDGWFADAIPGLVEFTEHRYLVGPQSVSRQERWDDPLLNVSVIRGGTCLARGAFDGPPGRRAGSGNLYLPTIVGTERPSEIQAKQLQVGDRFQVEFTWSGPFPVVEAFLKELTVRNVTFSARVGQQYSGAEFMEMAAHDFAESARSSLPAVAKSKVIRFRKE